MNLEARCRTSDTQGHRSQQKKDDSCWVEVDRSDASRYPEVMMGSHQDVKQ